MLNNNESRGNFYYVLNFHGKPFCWFAVDPFGGEPLETILHGLENASLSFVGTAEDAFEVFATIPSWEEVAP